MEELIFFVCFYKVLLLCMHEKSYKSHCYYNCHLFHYHLMGYSYAAFCWSKVTHEVVSTCYFPQHLKAASIPVLHPCLLTSFFILLLDWHICPSGTIGALPCFLIVDALLDECRLRWPPAPQQTPSILMKTDEVLGSPSLSGPT